MTSIRINIQDKTFPAVAGAKPHQAISRLEFSIESGEFVCLFGPSGCGKTTLLNIIAGLDKNFHGEITMDEKHASPNIGYVFQNPRLLPWRTVRENIELALTDEFNPQTIDFLLDSMNLLNFQDVYPERLSLGMSRRVSIVRGFAIDPDVLLMDEPFVSLDSPTARQARELLIALWKQRPHSVLFVTHDLREAISLADKIVFLSASPMRQIAEIPVAIPREQRNDEQEIENFRQQLLSDHPVIRKLL